MADAVLRQGEDGGKKPQGAAIAVVDFGYVDTSGEERDQRKEHETRLGNFMRALRDDLAKGGSFGLVTPACVPKPCSLAGSTVTELLAAAREAGADILLIGGVHKMSTAGAKMRGRGDRRQDRRVMFEQAVHLSRRYGRGLAPRRNLHRQRDRRGLKPACLPLKSAFRRMTRMERPMRSGFFLAPPFVACRLRGRLVGGGVPLTFQASAEPSPIKSRCFDFELDDFSGGAGIAGDKAADSPNWNRATTRCAVLSPSPGAMILSTSPAPRAKA